VFLEPFKPVLSVSNKTMVLEKHQLTLQCNVSASPKSDYIVWQHPTGRVLKTCEKSALCHYTIPKATASGRFTCIANNTKGQTSGTVDVTIGCMFLIEYTFFL